MKLVSVLVSYRINCGLVPFTNDKGTGTGTATATATGTGTDQRKQDSIVLFIYKIKEGKELSYNVM